jgi:3-oxoacyl-[acyl-carrier protein] reductase
MFDFSNRALLLHGASGGIGREIARTFHAAGAKVFIVDRAEDMLAALATELGGGTDVAFAAADLSDPAGARAATQAAAKLFGELDYMVNCAGIYDGVAVADMTDEIWRRSVAVNLDGVFFAAREVMPYLAKGGAIVNIASLSGHRGDRDHAHYAAAKAGSPGVIETPMALKQIAGEKDRILSATPLKRLGTPADVANAVAFLCSDASSFITGEVLHVNGGYFIAG